MAKPSTTHESLVQATDPGCTTWGEIVRQACRCRRKRAGRQRWDLMFQEPCVEILSLESKYLYINWLAAKCSYKIHSKAKVYDIGVHGPSGLRRPSATRDKTHGFSDPEHIWGPPVPPTIRKSSWLGFGTSAKAATNTSQKDHMKTRILETMVSGPWPLTTLWKFSLRSPWLKGSMWHHVGVSQNLWSCYRPPNSRALVKKTLTNRNPQLPKQPHDRPCIDYTATWSLWVGSTSLLQYEPSGASYSMP